MSLQDDTAFYETFIYPAIEDYLMLRKQNKSADEIAKILNKNYNPDYDKYAEECEANFESAKIAIKNNQFNIAKEYISKAMKIFDFGWEQETNILKVHQIQRKRKEEFDLAEIYFILSGYYKAIPYPKNKYENILKQIYYCSLALKEDTNWADVYYFRATRYELINEYRKAYEDYCKIANLTNDVYIIKKCKNYKRDHKI